MNPEAGRPGPLGLHAHLDFLTEQKCIKINFPHSHLTFSVINFNSKIMKLLFSFFFPIYKNIPVLLYPALTFQKTLHFSCLHKFIREAMSLVRQTRSALRMLRLISENRYVKMNQCCHSSVRLTIPLKMHMGYAV